VLPLKTAAIHADQDGASVEEIPSDHDNAPIERVTIASMRNRAARVTFIVIKPTAK